MTGWRQDKAWADRFLPAIEGAIRFCASTIIQVGIATDQQDQEQATDYVVTVSGGDIACRVRKWEYWERYAEVTLRYARPGGNDTEVTKIKSGLARWYLYAWAKDDASFGAWVFLDLDALRRSRLLDEQRRVLRNRDGSSTFIALPLPDLDAAGCIRHAGGKAATMIRQCRESRAA